jgi:putative effector of murein hydrolase
MKFEGTERRKVLYLYEILMVKLNTIYCTVVLLIFKCSFDRYNIGLMVLTALLGIGTIFLNNSFC